MRLPAALSDKDALQQVYALLRVNGLCATGVFAIMLLVGRMIDMTDAGESEQLRYAIMATLPLTWMATMIGGIFLIESRRLHIWMRSGVDGAGIGRMIGTSLTIVFAVVGSVLTALSLTTAAVVSWIAIDSGILL